MKSRKKEKRLIQVKFSRMPTIVIDSSSQNQSNKNNSKNLEDGVEIINQLVIAFILLSITWLFGFFILIPTNTTQNYTISSFVVSLFFFLFNILSSLFNLFISLLLNKYNNITKKLEKLKLEIKTSKIFYRCNNSTISEAQTINNQVVMTSFKTELKNY